MLIFEDDHKIPRTPVCFFDRDIGAIFQRFSYINRMMIVNRKIKGEPITILAYRKDSASRLKPDSIILIA